MSKTIASWSLSIYKMLMECELKCALYYYVAKRGEFETKPLNLQLAWRLKNMKNIFMFFGELVHQIIKEEIYLLLETGEVLSEEKIKERLRNRIEEQFNGAKNGLVQWYKDPKANPMLFEIFYNVAQSDTALHFIKSKIDQVIDSFIQSDTINKIIVSRTVRVMEAEDYRSFYLDGIRIVLSADLICHDEETNQWTIIDWKTGKKSQDDILQLAVYAMYLEKTYGANLSDIIVTNEYLEDGTSKSHVLDTNHTENLREIVLQSAKRLSKIEENLHLPDQEIMTAFQKTENKEQCERCNFKAICIDGDKDKHINNFKEGLRDKGKETEIMREWVRSGMTVEERWMEYFEESPYSTEESYSSKKERMSEIMGY